VDFVIQATRIDGSELATLSDLSHFRVVVLADVSAVPDEFRDRLRRFVSAGGGLLLILGDRVAPAAFTSCFGPDGADLTPALPVGLWPAADGPAAGPGVSTTVVSSLDEAALGSAAGLDFSAVRIFRLWRLRNVKPAAQILLSTAEGLPLVVSGGLGRGRVLLSAVPFDANWSNWPTDVEAQGSFVVFIHEMIYFLAGPVLPVLTVPEGVPASVYAGSQTLRTTEWLDPLGRQWRVPATPGFLGLRFLCQPTDVPGLCALRQPVETPDAKPIAYVAVQTDPAEFDALPLTAQQRERLSQEAGIRFYQDIDKMLGALDVSVPGRELWPVLAALAGLLLLGELYMTRRLAADRGEAIRGIADRGAQAAAEPD